MRESFCIPQQPGTGLACGMSAKRARWNRRSIRVVSAMAACAAMTALLLVVQPSVASASVDPGLHYVAIGDSYSSGEGNPPFEAGTNGNGDFCHRSQAAYPHGLASTFQTAPLLFYACSGAETSAVLTDTFNTEPPQIGQPGVDATANLVTLTIGGNNAGFSSVLKACIIQRVKAAVVGSVALPISRWLGLGVDPSCANSSSFTSSVDQQILAVQGPVENTYTALRRATDPVHTSIIVADYPRIFPETEAEQKCIQLSPFLTTDDQTWLNGEDDLLDSTLMAAASSVGVNMVDVRDRFAGHAVCGNSGAWINGVSIASGGGGSLIPVVGSFHPNASGHADGYAAAITSYINSTPLVTPEGLPANPEPAAAPSRARLKVSTATSTDPADSIRDLQVSSVGVTYPSCEGTVRAGGRVRVVGRGFAPSTSVDVYTTSPGQTDVEQQIGSVTSDSAGAIDTVVTVPVGATGFTAEGTSGNLIGFDAIGLGPGGTHADALTMVGLASRRSICGGATPIAGGEFHTIAVKSDGTVAAWGNNSFGQLGDGTLTTRTTPVTVNGLSQVSEVTAGDQSSYALTSSGTVFAWGDNTFGELGDGTTNTRTIPVQVSGLSDITQVAAGNFHALALKPDGTVAAWGVNNAGQLGDGTLTSRSTPVTVQGLTHVVQVAAGGLPGLAGHSVALKNDGTVWTWGYGKHGQLGQGSNTSNPTPTQVPGLTGIVQITASGDNTYALKSDGTVFAWGDDGFGQIGNTGANQNQNTPLQANISDVTTIAAGGTAALAIKTDGTVWDWGDNNAGQLGDDAACGKSCATPVKAIGLTNTGAIAGGYTHSLAETINGSVFGWGRNAEGELGNGTTTVAIRPTLVPGFTAEH